MATFAARRLEEMLTNVANIVAIELLAAAQGIEFHRPRRSSAVLEAVIADIRTHSPRYETDRSLSGDIEALARRIADGHYYEHARSILPSDAV